MNNTVTRNVGDQTASTHRLPPTSLRSLAARSLALLCVATMALSPCSPAFAANPAGNLRVEVVTAPNFVVDSNAGTPSSYAPRAAYLSFRLWNDGATDLTNVIAYVGNYTARTPGVYAQSRSPAYPAVVGPLPGGYFALTHEGGSAGTADATRYIGTIRAGQYKAVYWLVSYRQVDINNVPVWGTSVKPDDDLVLSYDIWVNANQGATLQTAEVTSTATMRNEISAMANKIYPNTANEVPQIYKDLLAQQHPTWTNSSSAPSPGTVLFTRGIWYRLGNVGQGFDANNDLVPDHDAWMQPVGDPSLFDAGAFRLVHSYAFVIVNLKSGGYQTYSADDQLYFTGVPENTDAFGWVSYDFEVLKTAASSSITPYQEVASGYDNEKFNGDFGAGAPLVVAGTNGVGMVKTANTTTGVPGGAPVTYSINYTNTGTVPLGDPASGAPLVVNDSIPVGTIYVANSATVSNTMPSGVGYYTVLFSANHGGTWTNVEPTASSVTDIQWWLSDALAASANGTVTFQVTVTNPYTMSPIIPNVGALSYGSATPFLYSTNQIAVVGSNALSGVLFLDNGIGTGGIFGDGLTNGTEGGVAGVTVSLYSDVNSNGVLDSADLLLTTTNTAATTGFYAFTNLFDGYYLAVLNTGASTLTGDTFTTVTNYAVNLDATHATANIVSSVSNNFGVVPALTLTKSLVAPPTIYEGYLVTNLITVGNHLPGNGTAAGTYIYTFRQQKLWVDSGSGSRPNV